MARIIEASEDRSLMSATLHLAASANCRRPGRCTCGQDRAEGEPMNRLLAKSIFHAITGKDSPAEVSAGK